MTPVERAALAAVAAALVGSPYITIEHSENIAETMKSAWRRWVQTDVDDDLRRQPSAAVLTNDSGVPVDAVGVGGGTRYIKTTDLLTAARRVVFERYYGGEDGWDRMKEAIGDLENLVGRPANESEI